MSRALLILLLLCSSNGIYARMYQWVDPATGSTQLSGKPPHWYRSATSGPRVFVFESSQVVDDTGIRVSDTERERLRQEAFLQADEDRQHARDKLLDARRLDAALMQKHAMHEDEDAEQAPVVEDILKEEVAAKPAPPAATDEPTTLEQMRKLIAEWEKATTEKARGLLDTPPTASKP